MTIVRVRLRAARVGAQFPFQFAYLIPTEREQEIFRLLGPAFSVRLTETARHEIETYRFDFRPETSGRLTARKYRIAAPLRWRSKGWIQPFVAARVLLLDPARQANCTDDKKATWRQKLAAGLPEDSALFHLGPALEDTRTVCSFCPQLLQHHMGLCVVGENSCHQNLVVPLAEIVRVPPGRAGRSANAG